MPEKLPDFGRLVAILSEARVRYVLIGGLAMRLQGCAHLTDDLDLCCARDNENPLCQYEVRQGTTISS